MERKMASIKEILDIRPIDNADSIELAQIDGWSSVIKKGQFRIGEKVVFCEPDALLPNKPEFEFMRSKKFRIRTCKLRGVLSQGICFPLDILVNGDWSTIVEDVNTLPDFNGFPIGVDVSNILGITKYESPVPVQLRGRMRGPIFRLAVPKTDEPRVQNIPKVLERHQGKTFIGKEKLDGTSASFYLDPETGLHCCSRNIDLAPDYEHPYNGDSYWRYAMEHNLEDVLKTLGKTIALQGELIGPGIQKNKYGLKDLQYRVFNMWDMTNHCYLDNEVMEDTVKAFGLGNDFLVPRVEDIVLNHSVNELLELANGKSQLADVNREGLVFRPEHEETDYEIGRLSFKSISTLFLLQHNE
jgi:RNA ligase (TIGR02306 family)